MYISITGLKTLNFLSEVKFWWYAIPSFRAAQKASGNIFCETKIVENYKHTLTAWKSKMICWNIFIIQYMQKQ